MITALLLLAAVGKTDHFLLHNFRALAASRPAFQQFLLLVLLNPGLIVLSFALDCYCLYRVLRCRNRWILVEDVNRAAQLRDE